jgi:hypothetical protein
MRVSERFGVVPRVGRTLSAHTDAARVPTGSAPVERGLELPQEERRRVPALLSAERVGTFGTRDARVVHDRQRTIRDQPRTLPLAPVHKQARAGGDLPVVRPDDRHARRARELDRERGAEHAREDRAWGRARRVDGEEARGQREVRGEVRKVAQDEERGEDARRERARGVFGVVQARELVGTSAGGTGETGRHIPAAPLGRCTG